MFKLLTLLGLLVCSSVGAQEGRPLFKFPTPTAETPHSSTMPPNITRIGDFLLVTQQDVISLDDTSFAYVWTDYPTQAVLKLACDKSDASLIVEGDPDPILFSEEAIIAWRFDLRAPMKDGLGMTGYQVPGAGAYAVQLNRATILAFSKEAYSAKTVALRVRSLVRGVVSRDMVFKITGYFKAVKRLPCARAFGF